MNIVKNNDNYSVSETVTTWTVKNKIGNVEVVYKIKKSDCPTFEKLKKYVLENDLF